MKNQKKVATFLLLIGLMGGSLFQIVRADDYEDESDEYEVEEKDEDESDEDDVSEKVQDSTDVSSQPKTVKQIIQLPDQIITKVIVEDLTLIDSDKDGIADVDDAHPTVPDFLIVKDVNENGIDDKYDFVISDSNGNGINDNYEKNN